NGSEFLAVGVGGGVTGFRADLSVVDDPVRGAEDAYLETIRAKQWEWFLGDLQTRMRPGGAIIVVMTPWHEEDLNGRIISEMARGGEQWIILRLPAEAEENDPLGREPGEFLWDDDPKYPYGQHLRREKATQSARNWSALYQGRPTPETGNYFQ